MKLLTTIQAGEKTCIRPDGQQCPNLGVRRLGQEWVCRYFPSETDSYTILAEKDGRLQRIEACHQAEVAAIDLEMQLKARTLERNAARRELRCLLEGLTPDEDYIIDGCDVEDLIEDVKLALRDVSPELPDNWMPIMRTTDSGKRLFVCLCCGRVSPHADKYCPRTPLKNKQYLDCWQPEEAAENE